MREPKRGGLDEGAAKAGKRGNVARIGNYVGLLKNPAYLYATLGYAMSTFTIGGISAWIPSFLQREAHIVGGRDK